MKASYYTDGWRQYTADTEQHGSNIETYLKPVCQQVSGANIIFLEILPQHHAANLHNHWSQPVPPPA